MNKLKNIGKVLAIMLVATVIMVSINPTLAYAKKAKEIRITVDGKQLKTDVAPIVKNSRTLVPFRAIFEGLGSDDITWHQKEQRVEAKIDDKVINLKIGSPIATVNGKTHKLDTVPIAINGRTLVPIRFIAESTGKYKVDWVQKDKLVKITTQKGASDGVSVPEKETPVVKTAKIYNHKLNKGFNIGDKADKVIKDFGQPARKDKSEYGFTWYIYNQDLSNYFQVGVKDGKIVAFITNSTGWKYEDYKIGHGHKNLVNKDIHIIEDSEIYIEIFSDTQFSHRVSTISIIEYEYELMFEEKNYTPEVLDGLAKQLHDLTNVYRIRFNKAPVEISDSLTELANYHANDMATHNFFSHKSSNGGSFITRAKAICGFSNNVSENISFSDSIAVSSNGLFNSKGHRKNMLNNNVAVGTSASHNPIRGGIFFVQNFKYDNY